MKIIKIYLIFILLFICANNVSAATIISASYNGVIVQPSDGYIVAVGTINVGGIDQILVARYDTSGVLDPSFGTNGYTMTSIGSGAQGLAIAIDTTAGANQYKIMIAGWAQIGGITQFLIARYTTLGDLDNTYASGIGYNVITAGGEGSQANAVQVDENGNAVVAGTVVMQGTPEILIARFNSLGNLDAQFGSPNGYVTQLMGTASYGYSIAIQADSKIVAGGQSASPVNVNNEFALWRFNTDGSLDTTFNGNGTVATPFGDNASVLSLVIQPTNNFIVAAGYSDNEVALTRYDTTGVLDTTFNSTGKVTTSVINLDKACAVGLDSSNNIIIAGISNGEILIARYLANGSLDTNFNASGIVLTFISDPSESHSLAIQTNDMIVVAGLAATNIAVARYQTNGQLDDTFGNGEFVIVPGSTVTSEPQGYIFAYDTTTQHVATANTMQDITFNTNVELDGWSHTASSALFTCTLPGKYLVRYDLEFTDISVISLANVFSAHAVAAPSGSSTFIEIPGSQGCIQLGALLNQTCLFSRSFIISAQMGDQFKVQFTGSATTNELIAGYGVGTTKPSASLSMIRILQ